MKKVKVIVMEWNRQVSVSLNKVKANSIIHTGNFETLKITNKGQYPMFLKMYVHLKIQDVDPCFGFHPNLIISNLTIILWLSSPSLPFFVFFDFCRCIKTPKGMKEDNSLRGKEEQEEANNRVKVSFLFKTSQFVFGNSTIKSTAKVKVNFNSISSFLLPRRKSDGDKREQNRDSLSLSCLLISVNNFKSQHNIPSNPLIRVHTFEGDNDNSCVDWDWDSRSV